MTNELVTTGGSDAIQIAQHIGQIQVLGQTLVKSGLLPQGVRSPEAAVAIILKGRELGIPPMQALSHIHVISGKPTLSAELMLAMVMKAGHEVWIVETTAKRCEIAGKRKGSTREQSLTFDMEDAQRAGVLNNPTWKKYPDAMLRARAISAFCRMFAPDVLMGASYTPEELGADVDDDGNIIDVQPSQRQAASKELEPTTEPNPEPVETTTQDDDGEFPPEPPEGLFGEASVTASQLKALHTRLTKLGFNGKAEHKELAREFIGHLVGRDLGSSKDLTKSEAHEILDTPDSDLESRLDAFTALRKLTDEDAA